MMVLPVTASLASEPQVVSRPQLVNLARQLVVSVDDGFERADDYLDKVNGRENFKSIPDGEVLLLQVGVGGRRGPKFPQPILAIKSGDDVLVSLFDFASVAQFAIDVKPAEKKAEGWFIRQNRKFLLDAHTMTVTADGQTYQLEEGDIHVDESDIMVRSAVLSKVFGFQADVSLKYQRLDVSTTQKWPALEKLERMKRKAKAYQAPPSLPRQEEPYDIVSVPSVDVTTSYDYKRAGADGKITRTREHSVLASGDMLGHTLRATVAGDQLQAVQSVRATLKKESDKPELLGLLKAREYEFGDITATAVAGAQGDRNGSGFRATNRNPYETSDATTEISGDVSPGWDVELYRGTDYIDIIQSAEGQYRFEDVRLSGGENKFRVVKYGPLGELEEEEVVIYSTPRKIEDAADLYEFSVSAADTEVWTRDTSDAQDKYTPIIAGNYERQLTIDTAVKGGLFTSQKDGEQKTYVNTGLATYYDGTILNAGVTADVDGSLLATGTARRQILGQNVTADVGYTMGDYGALEQESIPGEYTWGLGLRGALPSISGVGLGNYVATTKFTENDEDISRQVSRLSWSRRIAGLTFNNEFTHEMSKSPGSESESLDGRAGVSGSLSGTRWRISTDYNVDPEWHVNQYRLDLQRRLDEDLSGRLTLNNTPDTDFNEWEASLIWKGEHVTLAPGISYNTDRDFGAFVTANFGLAYDPHSRIVNMSGDKRANLGGVSAFVYLDKNGDMAFSEGDEPIQDAQVEAIHSKRAGITNERGEAFIPDIPSNLATDVKLNEFSFYDPFMVPGREGVSILPRPGHAARIEFPVHNGGELDGTVYVVMKDGKDRTAKNLRLYLHDMNGKLIQTASVSFDGFYLFQKIHPGEYWLSVDAKDADNQDMIRPLPEKLTFTYDGTLKYGHKVVMKKAYPDQHDVPSTIGEDYTGWLAANSSVDVNKIRNNLVINFGDFRSRALMNVMWYKLKMFNAGLIRDAELLLPVSQNNPDAQTGLHSLRAVIPGMTMEQAWDRCYRIIARGVDCKIEMLPTGLDKNPGASPDMQAALDAKRWGG